MFKVNLEAMARVEDELNRDYRQLDACMDELIRIKNALSAFSYMDEAIWQLNRKKSALRTEAMQVKQFAVALGNIQDYYRMADRRAEEYCEEQNVRLSRMTAGYQSLGSYDQILRSMNMLL